MVGDLPDFVAEGPPGRLELSPGAVGPVFQLPKQVRSKWQNWEAWATNVPNDIRHLDPTSSSTHEADKDVEEERVDEDSSKRALDRCLTLEERMALAEAKRQVNLEEKRSRASTLVNRAVEVADRQSERASAVAARIDTALLAAEERRTALCNERAERLSARGTHVVRQRELLAQNLELRFQKLGEHLDAKLEQAEALRDAQLAETACKAGETVARARRRQAEQRQRDAEEAEQRRAQLQARLERAAFSREAMRPIPQMAGQRYLARRSAEVAQLRRHHSARKLQRAWRGFVGANRTTRHFALAFARTGVVSLPASLIGRPKIVSSNPSTPASKRPTPLQTPDASPMTKSMPMTPPDSPGFAFVGLGSPNGSITPDKGVEQSFERLVATIQSASTLRCAQRLLRRLGEKLALRSSDIMSDVSGLMRRLYPRTPQNAERYPPRVFLCSYMMLSHPEVVFNQRGEREAALTAAAQDMVDAFLVLLRRLVEPAVSNVRDTQVTEQQGEESSQGKDAGSPSTAILLAAFDEAWVAYLEQFVAWKFADAATLEAELIRAAAGLEASMRAKMAVGAPRRAMSSDMEAVVEQVAHDQALLRERVQRLGGTQGLARLDAALAAARASAAAAAAAAAEAAAVAAAAEGPSPATTPEGSPSRSSTGLRSPGTPALPRPGTPESSSGNGMTNESMVWELLYDGGWALPTTELDILWTDATGETDPMKESPGSLEGATPAEIRSAVQKRLTRIAERAYWDSVQEELAAPEDEGNAPAQGAARVAALLGELGRNLAEVLPEEAPMAAQLRADLDPVRLSEVLALPQGEDILRGINNNHLLAALGHAAGLLRQLGAPGREAVSLQAQAAAAERLQAALAAGNSAALAAGVAGALRLLAAQLRLLRRDAMNFRLRQLSLSLGGGAGVRYARQKFLDAWGIDASTPLDQLAAVLPHTRALLAMVSGSLPTLEERLAAIGATDVVPGGMASTAQRGAPAVLRAGRAAPASPSSSAAPQSPKPAATLSRPAAARSWRGLVRLGLVQLASADTPASPASLPETLMLDAERLFRAQNEYGQIVVLVACLLVLQQTARPGQGMPPAAASKLRLTAMLADPAIRLPDLAAELARISGADPADEAAERSMTAGLGGLLKRSSAGYKALAGGIAAALQVALLAPDVADPPASAAIAAALARCGASALRPEVDALAARLAGIAAINEAVHADVYERLSADLL